MRLEYTEEQERELRIRSAIYRIFYHYQRKTPVDDVACGM